MTFPTLIAANTNGTTATTTPVVNLPASIVAGQTVWVVIRVAAAGAIGWPDGTWNEMFDASADGADDQMAAAWRLADGTEGSTITLSSGSGKFAAIACKFSGASDPTVQPPELSTVATGTSTTPDPTTCTPTGGAKDYLWIWLGGWQGEQNSPPAGQPTNYTNPGNGGAESGIAGAVATNCRVAIAERNLNAASEDPGSWTISASDDWTAYCMAVHPAGAAPPARVPYVNRMPQLLAH